MKGRQKFDQNKQDALVSLQSERQKQALREIRQKAALRLQQIVPLAVSTLMKFVFDPRTSTRTRIQAAKLFLRYTADAVELEALRTPLKALVRLAEEGQL